MILNIIEYKQHHNCRDKRFIVVDADGIMVYPDSQGCGFGFKAKTTAEKFKYLVQQKKVGKL